MAFPEQPNKYSNSQESNPQHSPGSEENIHGTIEYDRGLEGQFMSTTGRFIGGTTLAVVLAFGVISSCDSNSGSADKLPSGDVPAATADSSGGEHCVFEGSRPFRPPEDWDISIPAAQIVGIEDMPECRSEALSEMVRLNSTHSYATTTLLKGQRAFMPIRIVQP